MLLFSLLFCSHSFRVELVLAFEDLLGAVVPSPSIVLIGDLDRRWTARRRAATLAPMPDLLLEAITTRFGAFNSAWLTTGDTSRCTWRENMAWYGESLCANWFALKKFRGMNSHLGLWTVV